MSIPYKQPMNLIDDGLGIRECKVHPGCYTVPNYRRYCVDAEGVVYTHDPIFTLTPKSCKPTAKDPRGNYCFFTIIGSDGVQKNVLRHRMVLSAHKGFSDIPERIYVNHKNGIPGDDRLENLEWCTASENMIHSYQNGERDHILAGMESWNVETGEKILYSSVPEYCRLTNVAEGTIRKRLLRDNAFVYDGMRYRYTRDEWSTTTEIELRDTWKFAGEETLVLNVRSGAVTKYTRLTHACIALNVPKGIVTRASREMSMKPVDGYLFRRSGDDFEWPMMTPLQHEFIKLQNYPRVFRSGLALFDQSGNRVFIGFYEEIAERYGWHVQSVRNAVRRGELINGYRGVHISNNAQHYEDLVKQK